MRALKLALIGAGFAANLHLKALKSVPNVNCEIVGITSEHIENAKKFCKLNELRNTIIYKDAENLIDKSSAEVIDLVVPTYLHVPFAVKAAEAGKHVICEKPLTGYFGNPEISIEERRNVGFTDKAKMLRETLKDCETIRKAFEKSDTKFCYAENWVYAPPIVKAKKLITSSRGKILEIRCGESHSGSHSKYATEWKYTGGGSLIRMGAHPYGAAIHLKMWEGFERNGKPIYPSSIIAKTSKLREILKYIPPEQDYISSRPKDIEDWSSSIISFEDGTNAVVIASDVVLGGIENWINIYASNVRIECKISNNDSVKAYAPTKREFKDEYTIEKTETKAGWSYAQPDEKWMTGYPFEMQDFLLSIISDNPPESDLDLAIWTTKAMYSAYLSAESEKSVEIPQGFDI